MRVTVEELRQVLNNKYTTMPHALRTALGFIKQEAYYNALVNKLVIINKAHKQDYTTMLEAFIEYYKEYFTNTYYCHDKDTTVRFLVGVFNLSDISRTVMINIARNIILPEPTLARNDKLVEQEPIKVVPRQTNNDEQVPINRTSQHMQRMRDAKERKRIERLKAEGKL